MQRMPLPEGNYIPLTGAMGLLHDTTTDKWYFTNGTDEFTEVPSDVRDFFLFTAVFYLDANFHNPQCGCDKNN